jgi:hypothetical protein
LNFSRYRSYNLTLEEALAVRVVASADLSARK